ncbi:MAG TPA: ABC transporter ATP-binding protein [Candidatus Paceibacterota bacterium]|nr:ABC transporter ATP-binding protein [Candidatus Paceibacterota bacterium]
MELLKIENLKKHFGGVQAVADCSFVIKPGEITALIGPNGSGKTTVFNLISGVIRPDNGKIFLFDPILGKEREITHLSPDIISNFGISRVFQQSHLFANLSVEDNLLIAFDNRDQNFWSSILGLGQSQGEKKKIVQEYLEKFRLTHMKDKPARDLSFGQKRLVEIIRSLINPHHLLILDEPIAGVTPELRDMIKDLLRELRTRGETVLLIEHDMNFTLNVADHVVVMDAGKVIAEGAPDKIRHDPKVLEAYLD